MLIEQLLARKFEFHLSMVQTIYYTVERRICHLLFRRYPPKPLVPNLLNLGCGPHIYEDWINADDYAPKRRLRERRFRPNWRLDITRPWKCGGNYWDGIFTEHVIEHVTYAEAVGIFQECGRTLKPGAWLRISVPDLAKYVSFYRKELPESKFCQFPRRALALSFLTQMHMHKSVWDADLMVEVLRELGFVDVAAVSFGKGSYARLIRDDPDKAHESMYVEARKPVGRI